MIRVGIVVQRYGLEVVGGSETLARDVAERLNASGFDVTVFTTTAKDYITWKNEYKPGDTILKGVQVKRFNVEKERNIDSFNRFSETIYAKIPNTSPQEETEWLQQQGPYSPTLIEALHKSQPDFDLYIFFTYLYYSAIEGMKVIEKPVVLFPTAHDEPPIYLNFMNNVFNRPDALFFLTQSEMDFVKKKFNPFNSCALVRTGVEFCDNIDAELFKRRYFQYAPYILYAGRIEKGKGLELAFDAFHEIRKKRLVDFVLIGKKLMDIPQIDGIRYNGFVSEEEKLSAFKGAVVSIQPSPFESLSITTLESFSQKTPVLVNKKCHVLEEHVNLSGAGFAYEDVNDFIRRFYTLYDDRKLRKKMGMKGYGYVKEFYSWDVVMGKIKEHLYKLVHVSNSKASSDEMKKDE